MISAPIAGLVWAGMLATAGAISVVASYSRRTPYGPHATFGDHVDWWCLCTALNEADASSCWVCGYERKAV